jgi:hypothetical protein
METTEHRRFLAICAALLKARILLSKTLQVFQTKYRLVSSRYHATGGARERSLGEKSTPLIVPPLAKLAQWYDGLDQSTSQDAIPRQVEREGLEI